jgi:hypothetical protein
VSDNEIDDYVMKKLRKIQGEGFEMPGLATASESDISHFVMENLRAITRDRLDTLTDGLIQCLSLCHRLQNFRSDIPAWLEEIDNSVTTAKCNKFERAEHILKNFGIHTEATYNTYRRELTKSCGQLKAKCAAAHIEAKNFHLTRNPFPLGDLINAIINSNGPQNNAVVVATFRPRSSITSDLLSIDRICTWIYWTVTQQQKRV